ncbi:DnaA regulatory inactivator Hda [uncultured Comamonas sp.]|uniref:DnaA regulatory inactivator Hda n=1 Tax=uncultured Comamonas sp. TaxID=114710 RepID=UPI003749C4F3
MKQMALDLGLAPAPSLNRFFAGSNHAALAHLHAQVNEAWDTPRSTVPTYLWGEMGCGKTYVLRAVAEALREQGSPVGWLDASTRFPSAFNERWSAVILDEVQFYNPVQQAAAFNWFVNATSPATGARRWVLAAGDVPPSDLKLRDDLRTRLGWGEIYQLHLLSEAQRRDVLKDEAKRRGLVLTDDVMDYMLKRFSRDLGSLMQLLDHLDNFALRNKRGLTIPLLKDMLETE